MKRVSLFGAMLFCVLTAASAAQARNLALMVGVTQYDEKVIRPLEGPNNLTVNATTCTIGNIELDWGELALQWFVDHPRKPAPDTGPCSAAVLWQRPRTGSMTPTPTCARSRRLLPAWWPSLKSSGSSGT